MTIPAVIFCSKEAQSTGKKTKEDEEDQTEEMSENESVLVTIEAQLQTAGHIGAVNVTAVIMVVIFVGMAGIGLFVLIPVLAATRSSL